MTHAEFCRRIGAVLRADAVSVALGDYYAAVGTPSDWAGAQSDRNN